MCIMKAVTTAYINLVIEKEWDQDVVGVEKSDVEEDKKFLALVAELKALKNTIATGKSNNNNNLNPGGGSGSTGNSPSQTIKRKQDCYPRLIRCPHSKEEDGVGRDGKVGPRNPGFGRVQGSALNHLQNC